MRNEYQAIILLIRIIEQQASICIAILLSFTSHPMSFTLLLFNNILVELIWQWIPMYSNTNNKSKRIIKEVKDEDTQGSIQISPWLSYNINY